MKCSICAFVLSSVLGVGLVVAADAVAPKTPTTAPTTQAAPINKFCAIDRDSTIDPTVTYLYKGKVIGFCCEDCIPKFKKDPEKYMKDLK